MMGMAEYEVGYGKPPKEHQFKTGEVNNAGGKTSAQRKAEIEAAELAALVSRDLVKAVHDLVASAVNDEAKLEHLRSDTLALLRDVQNRAHGTPKASVDMSSQDGSMSPVGVGSSDIVDAIRRKHASETPRGAPSDD